MINNETYTADTLEYRDTDTEEKDAVFLFTVPREWAENWCKNNEWESLEEFDSEYIWDDSWLMYQSAMDDNVVIDTEDINVETVRSWE